MLSIKTNLGDYFYKSKPLYLGIKPIDKVIARENLLLFNQLLTENGVEFGLLYGTLLGAVREHDFISHDEDIDLFLLNEYRSKFLELLFVLRENGFELIRYDRRDLFSIERKGEYIDIYVFSRLEGGLRSCSGLCVLESFLVETCWLNFLGNNFLVPKEYVKYLESEYGQNWNIPIAYTDFKISRTKIFLFYIKEKIKELLPNCVYYSIFSRIDKAKIQAFKVKNNL